MQRDPSPVAVIEKNKREELRVVLTEFHGHPLVDVRTYTDIDTAPGERKATKKGISLNVAKLPDLIAGLQAALAASGERPHA